MILSKGSMKDIVFHIPRGLREYSIVQQAVIGRMVVLSHKGANAVLYSTEDAKRDGFTQTFNNALLALKNFLKIKKGFRGCRQITVSQVLQMDSCIYINVPVSVMQREDLNFAEKIVFGRIYTQTKQGTEKIKLTTSMLVNELGIADRTIKSYLKHLADVNLIYAQNEFNGIANERFVSVNVAEIEAHVNAKSAPTVFTNLHQQSSRICTNSFHDSALSSSKLQEHILQEHILQEQEHAFPQSAEECEPYFFSYIEKYKLKQPYLETMNVPAVASQFFEYYSSNGWKDSKGKPVKSIKGRVATWIGNLTIQLEREYRRNNPLANLKTYEQIKDANGNIPNLLAVRGEDEKLLSFTTDKDDLPLCINNELPF